MIGMVDGGGRDRKARGRVWVKTRVTKRIGSSGVLLYIGLGTPNDPSTDHWWHSPSLARSPAQQTGLPLCTVSLEIPEAPDVQRTPQRREGLPGLAPEV